MWGSGSIAPLKPALQVNRQHYATDPESLSIFLSTSKGVATAMVDVRGTMGLGLKRIHRCRGWQTAGTIDCCSVYRNLGLDQAQDVLDTIKSVTKEFPELDNKRVGLRYRAEYRSLDVGAQGLELRGLPDSVHPCGGPGASLQ